MGDHGNFPRWMQGFSNLSPKVRRIILALVAVIILVIVFHFISEKPAPVIEQPVVQSAPSNTDNLQTLNSLDALRLHSTQTESQLSKLKNDVSDLRDTLNESQAQNQKLQEQVSALADQVKILTNDMDKVLEKLTPKKVEKIVYHLRAVLPDRAWIMSSSGNEESVTMGDHVSGYGTIKSIDAKTGVLTTSSGRKIVFGPNDY